MAGKRGILFVHGIVGNNQIFDFLKPLIGSDDIVRYVVLEGHGGNALDFSRAAMSRWKAQVKDAIDEMSSPQLWCWMIRRIITIRRQTVILFAENF